VLLVDDDELTLAALARLLKSEGYEVHTAANCRDALRAALCHGCDVLVGDLLLPDGDGWDLLNALRAYRPVAAVAITGDVDPATARRAERAGFRLVLAKPLSFDDVARAVAQELANERGPHGPPD
jgi:CheY-like chemotaxis protein